MSLSDLAKYTENDFRVSTLTRIIMKVCKLEFYIIDNIIFSLYYCVAQIWGSNISFEMYR